MNQTPDHLQQEGPMGHVIRHYIQNGKFTFSAFYEGFGEKLPCTLGPAWTIRSVTDKPDELSFIAVKGNDTPVKFLIENLKIISLAKNYFEKIEKTLSSGGELIMPEHIFFRAGLTEILQEKESELI